MHLRVSIRRIGGWNQSISGFLQGLTNSCQSLQLENRLPSFILEISVIMGICVPFLIHHSQYGSIKSAAKSLQSYPTLCDPIDGSPPGSPIPGILQARTLEWVAISFPNSIKSRGEETSSECSVTLSSPHPRTFTHSLYKITLSLTESPLRRPQVYPELITMEMG